MPLHYQSVKTKFTSLELKTLCSPVLNQYFWSQFSEFLTCIPKHPDWLSILKVAIFFAIIQTLTAAPQLSEFPRMSEHIYLTHLLEPRINDALLFHGNLTGHCSGDNCSPIFTILISCRFASPFVPIPLPVLH